MAQTITSTSDDLDHRQYSLRLPTEGWPGCVDLGDLIKYQDGIPANDRSPIPLLTGPGIVWYGIVGFNVPIDTL